MKKLESRRKIEFSKMEKLQNDIRPLAGTYSKELDALNEKYYRALNAAQLITEQISKIILKQTKPVSKVVRTVADEMEEKRAIKEANVTSATYQRSQRILHRNLDNWAGR